MSRRNRRRTPRVRPVLLTDERVKVGLCGRDAEHDVLLRGETEFDDLWAWPRISQTLVWIQDCLFNLNVAEKLGLELLCS